MGYDLSQCKTAADVFRAAKESRAYGLSDQQVQFAQMLHEGHPQTKAAELAGYTGSSIAVTASRLKGNKKVRALLQDAIEIDDASKTSHALPEEVLAILTEQARHGDNSQARIRAAEALSRHWAAMGASRGEPTTLEETLDELMEYTKMSAGPGLLVALGISEAVEKGSSWRPSPAHVALVTRHPDLVAYVEKCGGTRFLEEAGKAPPRGSSVARPRRYGNRPADAPAVAYGIEELE